MKNDLKNNLLQIAQTVNAYLKPYWLTGLIAAVVLCLIVIGVVYHTKAVTKAPTPAQQFQAEQNGLLMLRVNLADMSTRLAAIEAALRKTPEQTFNSTALTAQIASVSRATQASQNAVSHVISVSLQTLQQQLSGIEKQLARVLAHKPSTMAVKLPFTVLHIDEIQGNAVATVRYAHTDFPLMQGDQLAGFELARASFVRQLAVFVDTHGQQAFVRLGSSGTVCQGAAKCQ